MRSMTTGFGMHAECSASVGLYRRNNSSYGGGGGGMRLWFDPTDILWYWDPFYYRRRRERRMRGEGMSFVESIFSFVFGDGDPNAEFEERRWQMVRRREPPSTLAIEEPSAQWS